MIIPNYQSQYKKNVRKVFLYLNSEQKREIVSELNTTSLYFLEMLLSKVNQPEYVYNDLDFSQHLGISLRVTQETRRKLQKAKYLLIKKIQKNDDIAILYLIGKKTVSDFLEKEKL